MKKYILTIDQGTTSTRSILFDKKANIVSISQMEIEQICPNDGWVEHNPLEIWMKTYQTIENVMKQSKVTAKEIAGIAITNQRETTILWDKDSGKPIYNAVVWQSRQSQSICDKLMSDGYEQLILSGKLSYTFSFNTKILNFPDYCSSIAFPISVLIYLFSNSTHLVAS